MTVLIPTSSQSPQRTWLGETGTTLRVESLVQMLSDSLVSMKSPIQTHSTSSSSTKLLIVLLQIETLKKSQISHIPRDGKFATFLLPNWTLCANFNSLVFQPMMVKRFQVSTLVTSTTTSPDPFKLTPYQSTVWKKRKAQPSQSLITTTKSIIACYQASIRDMVP